MRRSFTGIGFLIFFIQGIVIAQVAQRPSDFLTPEFHKTRREELRRIMPPNSVAVFFANAIRSRANDGLYKYHADPNFYYLTGHREPNAVLLIFKDMQSVNKAEFNETIFVWKHDALKEMYDGARLGKEGAREQLKFKVTYEGTEFEKFNIDFSCV